MAKKWDFRPAGIEFDDYSDDDEFYILGDRQTNTIDDNADTQIKNLQEGEDFKSEFRWTREELRCNPVVTNSSKNTSSIILIDDFRQAACRNDVLAVENLLQNGVKIESRLNSGWTVSMHAAYAARPDSLHCLLKHGADAKAHKDDVTVLMVACASTSKRHNDVLKCVDLLLDHGAEVNTYNRGHMSPLIFAAQCGHTDVVKRLIEHHAEIDEQDELGYTALMHAAYKGHIGVVQALLSAKADVGKQTSDGTNAADLAFIGKHKQLQKLLENQSPDQEHMTSDSNGTEVQKCEDDPPDQLTWSKGPAADSYTFTNMDLFLSGLELNEMIPVFQQKKITFDMFLRFTDNDLTEMGIRQLRVRKKILDTLKETHRKNWETSSLMPIDYNKKITCLDSAGMVANIHTHALYIASTVGYMSDQISADKNIILQASEKDVKDLSIGVEETIVNVRHLYKELHTLKTRLGKICCRYDFNPPDLILPSNTKSKLSRRRVVTGLAVVGGLLTVAWFKRDSITPVISQIHFFK